MKEREDRIRGRLQQASAKEAEAQEKIEEYRSKKEGLERQAEEKLRQAEEESRKRKQELLEEARKETDCKREAWLQALDKDKSAFATELKKRSLTEIVSLSRRALQDFADESLNNRLAQVLLERLKNLDQEAKKKFAQACRKQGLKVHTTFELDETEKRKITASVHEICGRKTAISYQADAAFPLGMEISADSMRLSWGIDEYLDDLQERVLELIEEQTRGRQKSSD
jgi:F-type H+-transporting ATPase subunit b